MQFIEPLETRRFLSHSHIAPPAAPTNLSASSDVSAPEIRLTWTDNSSKTGIIVERKKGHSGAWTVIATLAPSSTYYRDAHLAAASIYSYRVAAANRGGSSPFTPQSTGLTCEIAVPVADSVDGSVTNVILPFDGIANQVAINPNSSVVYTATDQGYSTETGEIGPAIWAVTTNGAAESSFGSLGKVEVNKVLPTPIQTIVGLAVQSDGKLLIAGNTQPTDDDSSPNAIIIARFNSNGTLDPTFGTGGTLAVTLDGQEQATAMTLAPDGSIYLAGLAGKEYYGQDGAELFSTHVTSAGAIDQGYGTNGFVEGDQQSGPPDDPTYGGSQFLNASMAYDSADGSVVIAAIVFDVDNMASPYNFRITGAKFYSNGTISDQFTDDGYTSTDAPAVSVDSDGRIVVVDDDSTARFNVDGSADTSWTGSTQSDVDLKAVAQLPSGNYLAVGYLNSSAGSAVIEQLNASDGSLIGSEVLDLPSGLPAAAFYSIAVSPSGTVFLGGSATNSMLISAYNPPDLTSPFATSLAAAQSVARATASTTTIPT